MQEHIVTCLWFDTQAEDAAQFYVSVFKNSEITGVTHYGDAGPREAGLVLTVTFEINGHRFMGLNGGPEFTHDEAVSFMITADDQDEVDYLWERLTSDGGQESQCGWLKDKFGVSWQVIPAGFMDVMNDPDPGRSQRAMKAMMQMTKLDLPALKAAADSA